MTAMPGQAVSGRSVAKAARYEPCPVQVKFSVGEEEFGQGFLQIFRFLLLAFFHQFLIFTFFFTAPLNRKKIGRSLGSFQLEKYNLEIEVT